MKKVQLRQIQSSSGKLTHAESFQWAEYIVGRPVCGFTGVGGIP